MISYPTLEDAIGKTPLVRLQRLPGADNDARGNVILAKLEGNNPAGSVKDRPAINMIRRAEERGDIKPGDTLIEATSGNTGIALAMAAAIRGYRMILIMPEDLSIERAQTMKAFGAELILTPKSGGMEYARDLADQMVREGKGVVLDQFANPDNPAVHYETTGPELWADTQGRITHFVSAMGTTGTITGVSRFLKEKNPEVRIVGAQPQEGSRIPGIRKWPEAYLPKIYEPSRVDELIYVRRDAAARRALQVALLDQVGLDHVLDRVALLADRRREVVEPTGPPSKRWITASSSLRSITSRPSGRRRASPAPCRRPRLVMRPVALHVGVSRARGAAAGWRCAACRASARDLVRLRRRAATFSRPAERVHDARSSSAV
jgi:cysteine synthase B